MSELTYIIILTIGPVQRYIKQARRTRDLFQGSRLLSYLSSFAVDTAKERDDATVIDPYSKVGQRDNIPNRVTVGWYGDEAGALACAEAMAQRVRKEWGKVSEATRKHVMGQINGEVSVEQAEIIWNEQAATALELYWIVQPRKGAKYNDHIGAANQALAARKLLRNFAQINEKGVKDSITGEQGTLYVGAAGSEPTPAQMRDFWEALRGTQHNLALLSSSERLGAISTIKRFSHETKGDLRGDNWEFIIPGLGADPDNTGQPLPRFPSTSSIAAAPFKKAVLEKLTKGDKRAVQGLMDALRDFINELLGCFTVSDSDEHKDAARLHLFMTSWRRYNPEYFPPIWASRQDELRAVQKKFVYNAVKDAWFTEFMCIDGDYLYEDTLITKTILEYIPEGMRANLDMSKLPKRVSKALTALRRLVKVAAELDIPPPQPYLAVLSMDGDKIGKALQRVPSQAEHKCFSKRLSEFAEDVRDIVEQQHLGRLVFSGGDDVLALLPVQDALKCAEAIRGRFVDGKLNGKKTKEKVYLTLADKTKLPITISAGIAYVHRTHDLQSAVRAAEVVQKDVAKTAYDRDALAVTLLRRSGEPRTMGSKWGESQSEQDKSQSEQDKSQSKSEDEKQKTRFIGFVTEITKAFRAETLGRSLPYDLEQLAQAMSSLSVPVEARCAEIKRIVSRRTDGDTAEAEKLTTVVLKIMLDEFAINWDLDNIEPELRTVQAAMVAAFKKDVKAIMKPFTDKKKEEGEKREETEKNIDEIVSLIINYDNIAGIVGKYITDKQVQTRTIKLIMRCYARHNRKIEARIQNTQHWVELARFIAQKEGNR